ncbi:thaumatin family protein [Streptomyces sp. TLI_171]|uniref:thaumatin family protein n=1 Tax=Streptomyces sp. TLI_171 TaxID=1938859 RepID=UPI00217EA804|nr:thaumatin family protein [Streptomyces sp. TLI_171]
MAAVLVAVGTIAVADHLGPTARPDRTTAVREQAAPSPATAAPDSTSPSTPSSPGSSPGSSPAASPSASPSASLAPATPSPSATRPSPGPQPSTAPPGERLITIDNRTGATVWAVATGSAAYPQGRRLEPGQSTSLTVPNNWNGRIWGRTDCASTAASHCAGGDCTTVCDGPNPPTTLGEFAFDAYAGLDFYDVSMVDGSNLPMYVNISHTTTTDPVSPSGCYHGVCTTEVDCPRAMQASADGRVVGCKPPCAAFGGDAYCCVKQWAGRENCLPSKWPVDYTQVFKKAAPYAYSYAFDDSATMPCKGPCYYRVTFGTTP